MKCSNEQLFTPIYLKLNDDMPWPEEENAFHLLTSDGLFLCRNTPFFRSCVPVTDYPSELAGQKAFLKLSYPRIPRRLMEQVVGFFDIIGFRHASEAAVLIAFNRKTNLIEILVPEQVGLVGLSWNDKPFPMELQYEVPTLPTHLVLLGDIHSHVDGPAYSSNMDRSDEVHRPGVHLVVGRIQDEPPQFHCEVTADGVRFKVNDLNMVMEGYRRRRNHAVPKEWTDKITVKPWSSTGYFYFSNKNEGGNSSSSLWKNREELEAKPLHSDSPATGEGGSTKQASNTTQNDPSNEGGCSSAATVAREGFPISAKPNVTGESPFI